MKKVLIGSPIKQKSEILEQFLLSLEELDKTQLEVHYYFVDDNTEPKSKEMLYQFKKRNENVLIKNSNDFIDNNLEYTRNSNTHLWKKELIERIILFKDTMIEYASAKNFDYLFLIDSDIVLNPTTIKHLISRNVDIVSNIFWTVWKAGKALMPQVWLQDESNSFINDWDNPLTEEQKWQSTKNFVNKLKIPGLYKVGGLGACTLISKNAIKSGISFKLIDNISFWGEDRHFCVRARAIGFNLYVDTVYPAYHIYREEDLKGVSTYKAKGMNPNEYKSNIVNKKQVINIINNNSKKIKSLFKNIKITIKKLKKAIMLKKRIVNSKATLTVSMIVHNEEKRYLKKVLEAAKKYADRFVIIDDASTDNTVQLCEKVLKDVEHKIIINETSLFANEYLLRKKQWEETIATNPDWILFLDADEILENKYIKIKECLLSNNDIDLYCFRVYDMWNETHYREDALWQNKVYHKFLLRYQPNFKYKFLKKKQHCGRMPANVAYLPYSELDIRVKHYGWSNEKERRIKYERYKKLDPDGKFGNIKQYESIMDDNPNLIEFREE